MAVQGQRLAGAFAGTWAAVLVHTGQRLRVERAQAGIGRRDQEAAAFIGPQSYADVAGGRVHVAAREQRGAHAHDLAADGVLGGGPAGAHAAAPFMVSASRKKAVLPKLPDLSARCMTAPSPGSRASVQGTPGQIEGPMHSRRMPRACTTAPDVSPPATTRRRTPASTRPRATRA